MKKFLTLLLVMSLFLSACSPNTSKESSNQPNKQKRDTTPLPAYWPTEEWKFSTPEKQGMDSAKLVEMYDFIDKENKGALHGLMVIRNGYVVAEKYGGSYTKTQPHNMYSVTKSVTGATIGIAVGEGLLNLEDRVFDYFPTIEFENMSEEKESLTIKHLLTMTTGMDWPELEQLTEVWENWDSSEDQLKYYLDKPVLKEQFGKFNYDTGATHTLSAIFKNATKTDISVYAKDKIFDQIGMKSVRWSRDKKGITMGGAGIFMTPRDMARFGYLYLHNGTWDGKQIIPEDWVEASTSPQTETGLTGGEYYGYCFWQTEYNGHKAFEAVGAHNQVITVIPDLDLIVVMTSEYADYEPILVDYILPSITSSKPIPDIENSEEVVKTLTGE